MFILISNVDAMFFSGSDSVSATAVLTSRFFALSCHFYKLVNIMSEGDCLSTHTLASELGRNTKSFLHCFVPVRIRCTHMDWWVHERAPLRVTGLADCCIIFGRASPSLWRASLKIAGSCSLCRPLSGCRTPANLVQAV